MSYAFSMAHDMRTYLSYLTTKKQVVALAEDTNSSDNAGDNEELREDEEVLEQKERKSENETLPAEDEPDVG